jgi:hypothetical protein
VVSHYLAGYVGIEPTFRGLESLALTVVLIPYGRLTWAVAKS